MNWVESLLRSVDGIVHLTSSTILGGRFTFNISCNLLSMDTKQFDIKCC